MRVCFYLRWSELRVKSTGLIKRLMKIGCLFVFVLCICGGLFAYHLSSTDLPPPLKRAVFLQQNPHLFSSLRIVDRSQNLMRLPLNDQGVRRDWVKIEEIPSSWINALLCLEDRVP